MALSAFDDPSEQPQAAALHGMLGETAALWASLLAHLSEAFAPVTELWSFSGAKFGWSLRARQGDRIILYMTPPSSAWPRSRWRRSLPRRAARRASPRRSPRRSELAPHEAEPSRRAR